MKNSIIIEYFRNTILLNCLVLGLASYRIELLNDGPIVKGANITFNATIYHNGELADGKFKFRWTDTAVPIHSKETETEKPTDTWKVFYNGSIYPAGRYVAQVEVCQNYLNIYCYPLTSSRVEFYVNDSLNGRVELIQNNKTRHNNFVSNTDTVVHNISFKATDAELIKQAPTVLTYWFVDCIYYGFTRDYKFLFNYTEPDKKHVIEALVVADFTPLPPPSTTAAPTTTTSPTTTTTVKPISTTSVTTAIPKTTITTVKPKGESLILTTKSIVKRQAEPQQNETQNIMVYVNGTLQRYNGTFPYVCNGTQVATDPKKTYGFFSKTIKVRSPVSKINVTGNNWLQHGDLLTLNVKCHASRTIRYCVNFIEGVYNVTGNETCSSYKVLETCEFTIYHYFGQAKEYTIVVIIENEVNKIATPIGVTVYQVKRQAQLSVIVVPVAFSLVAVVLIVFGVAYYFQNRSRFVVEVANFDFGQNYSDMEYKTFKERLRDSISNAFFTRAPSPGSSEVPVWPPGRKYGSMTT